MFEKIRVRLKFEQVRDNAIRFLQLRDKINPNCRVWIRMIRQDSNYNEWDEYYDFGENILLMLTGYTITIFLIGVASLITISLFLKVLSLIYHA